jgi:hypothetical protein
LALLTIPSTSASAMSPISQITRSEPSWNTPWASSTPCSGGRRRRPSGPRRRMEARIDGKRSAGSRASILPITCWK